MSNFVVFNDSSFFPENSSTIVDKVFSKSDEEAFRLKNFIVTQYKNHRETELKHNPITDDYDYLIHKFLHSDVAVFISPVYWRIICRTVKVFMDFFSELLNKTPSFRQLCKGKKIVLVVIGGDNPQEKAHIIALQLKYICAFLGMTLCHTFKGIAKRVDNIEKQHDFTLSIKSYFVSNFIL